MNHSTGHVCIFTTAHPTDDVRVNSRIASYLMQSGYKVTWVGPDRSYFQAISRFDSRIEYRLFRDNSSKLKRLTAGRAARRKARRLQDVDWWYCPDPDSAATALEIAKRQGGRVLFDIHEVFHGALLDRWFPARTPGLIRKMVRRRISRTCAGSDLIIGVNRAVLKPYVGKRAYLVIKNCAPLWFSDREAHDTSSEDHREFRVMHGRCCAQMVPSRSWTPSKLSLDSAVRLKVCMSIGADPMSPVVTALREKLSVSPIDNMIELQPGVPHESMPRLLQGCNVGMIAYGRDLGVDSLPNRVFEYMASGLAILAPFYAQEIACIVESERIGILADFEDPGSIAAALRWLSENPDEVAAMGVRARAAFLSSYNWEVEGSKLVQAMRDVGSG